MATGDASDPTVKGPGVPPGEAPAGDRFGKFVRVSKLGAGGMPATSPPAAGDLRGAAPCPERGQRW